ncbi:MAG: penicillin-binding protein, partial [Acidobacteriia bacterium]|nr:penicillin-binding protein [Terriglobia bacterium]
LGLGEKATLDMDEEQPGTIAPTPPSAGGMGLMTAYGEGFSVTPLELAALVSAIANGGTLYYLQYPRTEAEAENLVPKIKRQLDGDIAGIADIRAGMRGAVDYGTAQRAAGEEDNPIYGKTGTCTDFRFASHMGWFASFNEVGTHKLAVVVMLAGGHETSGGAAAGVAGAIYRSLAGQRYFAATSTQQNAPQFEAAAAGSGAAGDSH